MNDQNPESPWADAGGTHDPSEPPEPPVPPPGGPAGPGGPGSDDGAGEHSRPLLLVVGIAVAFTVLIIGLIVFLAGGDDDDAAPAASSTTSSMPDDESGSTSSTSSTTSTSSSTSSSTSPTTSTTTPPTTTTSTTTTSTTTTAPTTTAVTTTTVSIPVVTVPPTPAPTLWDIIANSPDLSAFAEVAELTGIDQILNGSDPITVFIPSNQAMEQFAAGIGNDDITTEELEELLRHHILPDAVLADDVVLALTLTPLLGPDLVVDADAATIDGARLLVVDVGAGNSVLHVIDRVLALR